MLRSVPPRRIGRLAVRCALVGLTACDRGCDGGSTAANEFHYAMDAYSGGGQLGFVAAPLSQRVEVRLLEQRCNTACSSYTTASDVPVTWTASSGSVSSTTTTSNNLGIASVEWTLGATPGVSTLTATAPDRAPVTITATGMLHRPRLAVVFGDNQIAPPGAQLPLDIFVQLTDTTTIGTRAGVPGATVSWQPASPSASVSAATSTTDAQGRASARWTLGSTVGPQALSASVSPSALNDASSVTQILIPATAQFSAARVLRIVSGNAQIGIVGRAQRQPVVVEYVSLSNNTAMPIENATISFVANNAGSVGASTVRTDVQGRASVTWTMGGAIGAQSLSVSTPNVAGADPSSVFAVTATAVAEAATVVLQDNFDTGNQWLTSVTRNDFGAWTSSRTVVASGGNPGGFARLTQATVLTTNPTFSTINTQQLFTGATYDPSARGAIASIDYAVDRQTQQGVYDAFVVVQGGVEYRAEFAAGSVYSNAAWQTATLTNLQPANFSPSPGPNFSASGGSMQFGFTRAASQRFAFFSNFSDIDNWTVTIKR